MQSGNRKYCSHYCRAKATLHTGDVGAIRHYLTERDKEICQVCGMDCGTLKKVITVGFQYYLQDKYGRGWFNFPEWEIRNYIDWCRGMGIQVAGNGSTWHSDHIIPIDHGGKHAPDNLRTICVQCHLEKSIAHKADNRITRRQAIEFAKQKKHLKMIQKEQRQ